MQPDTMRFPARFQVSALAAPAAIAASIVVPAVVLASAGGTLGYDLHAYTGAAERLLAGRPLYDPAVDVAGGFAIYLYPPPFAVLAIPFVSLTATFGPWPWILLLAACFAAGVALLPVSRQVRWTILLLAGLSWPLAYSLKLGQVGPILFLLFAAAWRWRDRPGRFAAAAALGTIVKVQPGLLFAWALLAGRRRAVAIGAAILAVAAVVATAVVGPGAWMDYVALLGRVSGAVTTPHNFSPGAIAFQMGVPEGAATALQWISTLAALACVAWAALRAEPEVGLLTAVTASQLISPLLWDHYALLLLLPTAWLLGRGQRWAAAIPLSTSVLLLWLPPVIYPIAFWVALAAPLAVGRRSILAGVRQPMPA